MQISLPCETNHPTTCVEDVCAFPCHTALSPGLCFITNAAFTQGCE